MTVTRTVGPNRHPEPTHAREVRMLQAARAHRRRGDSSMVRSAMPCCGCARVRPVLLMWLLQLPPAPTDGYAPDTVLPLHTPRDCNCSTWAAGAPPGVSRSFATSLWASEAALRSAGAACAFPGRAVTPLPNASSAHDTGDGWCLCDGSSRWDDKSWTWCDPPAAAPSQINLLVINATAVGVNFVTADEGRTAGAVATAEFRVFGAAAAPAPVTTATGFSTLYADPGGKRRLSYHHVILAGLQERTEYEYRVSRAPAGPATPGTAAVWSGWKRFRSLYSTGVTRVAMYGDMGIFPATRELPGQALNNIGNLIEDVAAGRIDWVVHSGDHAYEFEECPEGTLTNCVGSRGDGYMDSYEALLAHAPWAPGFGNHEYLRGDKANRLLNITGTVTLACFHHYYFPCLTNDRLPCSWAGCRAHCQWQLEEVAPDDGPVVQCRYRSDAPGAPGFLPVLLQLHRLLRPQGQLWFHRTMELRLSGLSGRHPCLDTAGPAGY